MKRGESTRGMDVERSERAEARQAASGGEKASTRDLQRSLGNRGFRRWIGERAGMQGPALQLKARAGSSADPLEGEADRLADEVAGGAFGDPAGGRGSTERAVPRALPHPTGGGESLPATVRSRMESSFGRDFSGVRIHRDGAAHAAAEALDARALTAGGDVAFGPGEYAPDSPRGRWLMAHELAHVVQQGAAPARGAPEGATAPSSGARSVQLKPKQPESEQEPDSTELVGKLKAPKGGMGEKLPLTPGVLAWVEEARSGGSSGRSDPQAKPNPRDPKNFATRRHSGEAFVWGEADERPIDATDVSQGYLGDCYLMALLAAIAEARPEFIEEMITRNDDGSFTVRFFGPKGRVDERVEPTFPTYSYSGDPTYAKYGDVDEPYGKELWPMLVEKAWAQSIHKVEGKGQPRWLDIEGSEETREKHSQVVTGAEFKDYSLPNDLSDVDLLARLVEHFTVKRLPVTFASHEKSGGAKEKSKVSGVILNHGYGLRKVDAKGKLATLYNPHGPQAEHMVDKPMSFLRANFRSVRFYQLASAGAGKTAAAPPTKEESVAAETVPEGLLKESGYDELVGLFEKEVLAASSVMATRAIVQHYGYELWTRSKDRAQSTKDADTDDRPLYWSRLQMAAIVRKLAPKSYRMTPLEKEMLLDILEATSRGRAELQFDGSKGADERRILVSGFDPFGFQGGGSRRQANPAGAAVLALDGGVVPAPSGGLRGRIEGVIFPVRFKDFDAGIVEKTFQPYLKKDGKAGVDMIMTISQGGSTLDPKAKPAKQAEAFELEQFAGRRRSTPAPDNTGVKGAQDPAKPEVGKRMSPGAEFVESSLPRADIHKALGRKETADETNLSYLPKGATEPVPTPSGGVPAKEREGAKAVEGSGGGYLSNEIFYRTASLAGEEHRTAVLAGEKKPQVPVGHLHVPYLPPPTDAKGSEKQHAGLRDRIIGWVKKIIAAALPSIGKK